MGLLAVAGIFLSGYAVRGEVAARKDATERAAIAARTLLDDALRETLRGQALAAREAARASADRADDAVNTAAIAAREAATLRRQLAGAVTPTDSLPIYQQIVAVQDSQIEALDSAAVSYLAALAHQGDALMALQTRIATDSTALDWLRTRRALMPTPPEKRTGRMLETGGIALATIGACSQGVTIGCVAGAVVTLVRVL